MRFPKQLTVVSLLLLTFLSSFLLTSPSYAKSLSAKSPSLTCYYCESLQTWPGTVHGAKSFFTVSNPGGSGFGNFSRYIILNPASNCNNCYLVEVGIDKGFNCPAGAVYYYYLLYNNGYGTTYRNCYKADSADINSSATFGASYYVSNGGGTMVYITNTFAGDDDCSPCSFPTRSLGQTFSSIVLHEEINATWTGHEVWGSTWTYNLWQNVRDGSWNYQNNEGSGISAANPPQMYWNIAPTGGSNDGGQMVSCDYDTGTRCTIGH